MRAAIFSPGHCPSIKEGSPCRSTSTRAPVKSTVRHGNMRRFSAQDELKRCCQSRLRRPVRQPRKTQEKHNRSPHLLPPVDDAPAEGVGWGQQSRLAPAGVHPPCSFYVQDAAHHHHLPVPSSYRRRNAAAGAKNSVVVFPRNPPNSLNSLLNRAPIKVASPPLLLAAGGKQQKNSKAVSVPPPVPPHALAPSRPVLLILQAHRALPHVVHHLRRRPLPRERATREQRAARHGHVRHRGHRHP